MDVFKEPSSSPDMLRTDEDRPSRSASHELASDFSTPDFACKRVAWLLAVSAEVLSFMKDKMFLSPSLMLRSEPLAMILEGILGKEPFTFLA